MAVKVYKTVNPGNLSTVVKGVRLSFRAGTMHTPGVYSTDNVELQKAIEADPEYGQLFKLVFSGDEPADNVKADVPEKPKAAGRPKKAESAVESLKV